MTIHLMVPHDEAMRLLALGIVVIVLVFTFAWPSRGDSE
jgi:hypothetical protein